MENVRDASVSVDCLASATQSQLSSLAQLDTRHQELIRELECQSSIFALAEVENVDVGPALSDSLRLLALLRDVLDEKLAVSRVCVDVAGKHKTEVERASERMQRQRETFEANQSVEVVQAGSSKESAPDKETRMVKNADKKGGMNWKDFRKKLLSSKQNSGVNKKKLFKPKTITNTKPTQTQSKFKKPQTHKMAQINKTKSEPVKDGDKAEAGDTKNDSSAESKTKSGTEEAKYCTCGEVFNGDMIACDERSCEIEWFHFRCMGLKSAPRGKWYCPSCSKLRNIRETPKRQAKKT